MLRLSPRETRWIFVDLVVALICFAAAAGIARAAPLTASNTYAAAHPAEYNRGTPALLTVKGTTDNQVYVLEADPATGALPVSGSMTLSYDTNYGAVGANTLRTAAQIGNATGAAAFNAGTTTAQTLRVVLPTDQTAIPITDNGGSITVDGTVAATQSGTWTVQPGNTANTTPWLFTINQGGNSATVTGANALKVDGSAVTQPVSGTVTTSNFPATVSTNNGAADASTLRVAVATDSTISAENFPTTVDTNVGTPGASTVRTIAATSATGSNQAKGKVNCTDLTGAYQTIVTPAFNTRVLYIFNGCNGVFLISIDGGTTDFLELESGESVTIDLTTNNLHIGSGVNIQAKDGTTPPTTGTLRISAAG